MAPRKKKNVITASSALIRAYQDGEIQGWGGVKDPVLLHDTRQEYFSRGIIYPFQITRTSPSSIERPEYFSLHRVARQVINKDIGGNVQEIGDCHIGSSMVRMADGSEKAICEVKVGEMVMTHMGRARPVVRVIHKPYSGELVTLKVKGATGTVTVTPDHEMMRPVRDMDGGCSYEWTSAEDYCQAGGRLVVAPGGDVSEDFPVGPLGLSVPVTEIVRSYMADGTVYCLEVAEDHSFVANGFVTKNCVSFGARHTSEYVSVCNILLKRKNERFRHLFTPWFYGTGRVYVGRGQMGNSDGSLGSWMAKAVEDYGCLFLDEEGLPKYSGSVAKRWGDPNPKDDLDKWKEKAAPYKFKAAGMVTTWDQLCDAIANGYAVNVCSNQGFEMTPGSDGYHDARGSWAHSMNLFGYGPDYGLIANSWGDVHGKLKDFHTDEFLPVGTIRARKRVIEGMLAGEDSFAYTEGTFYPEQDLPKALFYLLSRE